MSDNDLVFRGDVLMRKCKYYVYDETGCCCEEFAVPVEDINRIPAVPHEMSARELFNAYRRICEEYSHKGIPVRCDECPLYTVCPEIGKALRVMVIWSHIIERWAQEHPEQRKVLNEEGGQHETDR
jgi:hypothetical protein